MVVAGGVGAASMVLDQPSNGAAATTVAASVASAGPSYLPSNSTGIMRAAVVVGVIVLILVQLWILSRKMQAARIPVPVEPPTARRAGQRSARRNLPGSSINNPD
jgi:hypothetical protein